MNKEYPIIDVKATGARIRELRKECGFTIREVSEYMGFTTDQAVCKWQRGESLPTVDNLYALSKLYGKSMEDILVGDDRMSSLFMSKRKINYTYGLIFKSEKLFYDNFSGRQTPGEETGKRPGFRNLDN